MVREAEIAPAGFDARHSAIARRYRYLVVNAPVADPLLAGLAWHVADPLDLRSMAGGGRRPPRRARLPGLLPPGPGDVAGRPDQPAGARRPLDGVEPPAGRRADRRDRAGPDGPEALPVAPAALVPEVGSLLAFEIEANAFCHQMVRSLVGTLVDVGRGRKRASDMLWILRSADRQQASQPAPPQGLTLTAVRYGR